MKQTTSFASLSGILRAKYLKHPDIIRTREGVRNSMATMFEGNTVLHLHRFMYPKRWIDMAAMFGRAQQTKLVPMINHPDYYKNVPMSDDFTIIELEGPIFYFVVKFLDEKLKGFLFFDTPRIIKNLGRYCAAIDVKALGCIEGVWRFIDETFRRICGLSKGHQAMCNGHKRVHAMNFQTAVTPDGIISYISGPAVGRRHDLFMLNPSRL
ncbi:LOW QUALITY PROTEIN: hypothetical protein PHMEG_0007022 [Phytophthora megakarya]|uniref:DDE Tnp4 domain-containing protein n=1 Tax=Phytophthora megakarya TaxID=4795 RepID=A0A225WMD9_9STRA|nr:LOW QUALITY PROTEIN: hypothetical protein PHMEG_0007022 [Phytophthora megakarya]